MSVWEHYARSQVVESHEVAGTLAREFNERQDNVMKGGPLADLDLRDLSKAYISIKLIDEVTVYFTFIHSNGQYYLFR